MTAGGVNNYYFGGKYEIVNSKEILYLCGDAYSAPAVMVKENGTWKVYYIGRDYLGSITHVFKENGTLQKELSFDAWGRLRNPANHTPSPQGEGAGGEVLFLGRGYTGHEHLTQFGLINMNARLYDPALGRFLSPDPYIQDPTNRQNFNRYSYALNNPLKYTDPSGEILYLYDNLSNCYRDEWGNRVDYSDVYRAMFESGYFRPGGNMWDGTSYTSGSYGYSNPLFVIGGDDGARAGYKWVTFYTVGKEKGEKYTDSNGITYTMSFDSPEVNAMQVPDISGVWLASFYGTAASTVAGFRYTSRFGGGWWVGKNGKIYDRSILQTTKGSKLGMYKYSEKIAANATKGLRIFGNLTAGLMTGYSLYNFVNQPNLENGANTGVSIASFFVWEVAPIYMNLDLYVKGSAEQSRLVNEANKQTNASDNAKFWSNVGLQMQTIGLGGMCY
jgi:RHS repeat-associated protein